MTRKPKPRIALGPGPILLLLPLVSEWCREQEVPLSTRERLYIAEQVAGLEPADVDEAMHHVREIAQVWRRW